MKRHLMKQLVVWQQHKQRKPLILKGVRQTGKTYLLEQFGLENFRQYHIINFEKQISARQLFEGDLEPKRIVQDLSFYLKSEIDIKKDLVVFDEIQACPKALTSLKYFCEDLPELALCGAGSLLGLHLNDGSYPVGKVDMLHLYPMTFSEFLAGIGDSPAVNYLSQISFSSTVSEIVHQHLWQRLKQYFITGGLPEVVSVFAEYQDDPYKAFQAVRKKQEELISAYYADIAKHSGKVNTMHIDRTWRSIPLQLSQSHDDSSNRFKFKGVIPQINRYTQLVNVIDWLESAELIIKLPVVKTIRQPLSSFTKPNIFKLFLFDVGILGAMSGLDPKIILDYDYGTYKGCFAENFVIQQLIVNNSQRVFNWQEGRSEVEFILQKEGVAIPIEVKSGKIVRAQSLQKYIDKYKPEKSFILSAKNITAESQCKVFHVPLYFAEKL